MKKIEAIIRHEKLDEVKSSLDEAGIVGLTISEVMGRGRQKGFERQWRGMVYVADLVPKIKLEIVVDDKDVELVIEILLKAAWTGDTGDGKIFVVNVEEVIRVRTGERGRNAI